MAGEHIDVLAEKGGSGMRRDRTQDSRVQMECRHEQRGAGCSGRGWRGGKEPQANKDELGGWHQVPSACRNWRRKGMLQGAVGQQV